MNMEQIIFLVNDDTMIKIYEGENFITKGNWFSDSVLKCVERKVANINLDCAENVCKITLVQEGAYEE
jgi:hypothetical protein